MTKPVALVPADERCGAIVRERVEAMLDDPDVPWHRVIVLIPSGDGDGARALTGATDAELLVALETFKLQVGLTMLGLYRPCEEE